MRKGAIIQRRVRKYNLVAIALKVILMPICLYSRFVVVNFENEVFANIVRELHVIVAKSLMLELLVIELDGIQTKVSVIINNTHLRQLS